MSYVRAMLLAAILSTVLMNALASAAEPEQGEAPTDAESRELLDQFAATYALPDGEFVKHVAPPFIPGRLEYYRVREPQQAAILPEGPDYLWFYSGRAEGAPKRDGNPSLRLGGMGWLGDEGPSIAGLITTLTGGYYHHRKDGVRQYELVGDRELMGTNVPGDWIVRAGASPEEIVEGLETVLRDDCGIPIRLCLTEDDRKVLVAEGEYSFHPLPGNVGLFDEHNGEFDQIDIFDRDRERMQGGPGSKLDHVLRHVAMFIGRPIFNESTGEPDRLVVWRWSARRFREIRDTGNVDEAAVLKHLTEQTGLTFREETRRLRVLKVEREELGDREE